MIKIELFLSEIFLKNFIAPNKPPPTLSTGPTARPVMHVSKLCLKSVEASEGEGEVHRIWCCTSCSGEPGQQ